MLYKLQFEDGSIYKGGNDIYNTGWKEIPREKSITSFHYALPNGDILTLKGYEAYNHLVEATQNFYGTTDTKCHIQAIYLMGLKKGFVTSYRITLFEGKNSKYKMGDITKREYQYTKEYYGRPTTNWKKGVLK